LYHSSIACARAGVVLFWFAMLPGGGGQRHAGGDRQQQRSAQRTAHVFLSHCPSP
jgi:hypothetical protein